MTPTPELYGTDVETDEVTVVVATRNRGDRLIETFPHHRARTILVDNASDEPQPLLPGVEIVHLAENRGAAARNVGVERARTPYVAFADDDSYWTPGSLARAAALLRSCGRSRTPVRGIPTAPPGPQRSTKCIAGAGSSVITASPVPSPI